MNFSSQVLLGLAGATGAGTAIGVPVALHVQGLSGELSKNSSGGGNSQVSVSIDKCVGSEAGREIVTFGSQVSGDVCGTIEKSSGSTSVVITEDAKFNQLFKNMGGHPKDEGKMYSDFGRADCPKGGNQGIFTDKSGEKGYLGICEVKVTENSSESDELPSDSSFTNQWMSVDKQNQDSPVIRVCQGDCFDTKYSDQGKVGDVTKEKGTWNTIIFQKKSSR